MDADERALDCVLQIQVQGTDLHFTPLMTQAIAAAIAEAERAQMERDCAAVCGNCRNSIPMRNTYWHEWNGEAQPCSARNIRVRWAVDHASHYPAAQSAAAGEAGQ